MIYGKRHFSKMSLKAAKIFCCMDLCCVHNNSDVGGGEKKMSSELSKMNCKASNSEITGLNKVFVVPKKVLVVLSLSFRRAKFWRSPLKCKLKYFTIFLYAWTFSVLITTGKWLDGISATTFEIVVRICPILKTGSVVPDVTCTDVNLTEKKQLIPTEIQQRSVFVNNMDIGVSRSSITWINNALWHRLGHSHGRH